MSGKTKLFWIFPEENYSLSEPEQPHELLEITAVGIVESAEFTAVDIEHSPYFSRSITDWNDDF